MLQSLSIGNLVVLAILFVFLIVVVKILKSLGKGILLLGCLLIAVFVMSRVFPEWIEPISEFIGGSWLEPNRREGPL